MIVNYLQLCWMVFKRFFLAIEGDDDEGEEAPPEVAEGLLAWHQKI